MQVIRGDAVNFLSGPGDVLLAVEEGDEGLADIVSMRPGSESDLDGGVTAAGGCASGLKVDGGEDGFGNFNGFNGLNGGFRGLG